MLKKIFSAIMAVGVLATLTACGDKTNTSSVSSDNIESQRTFPNELVTAKPKDSETTIEDTITETTTQEIVAAEDGPRLYMGNTTAKAGEYAEATLYVENAELKWNMCGIHITYPDVLEPEMLNPEERTVRYKRGDASEYSTASVAMAWKNNLPDELVKNKLGCIFFTEVFDGDNGLDGAIVTIKLKIPEDAKSGTVYPLGFYYMDTDKFINDKKDLSLQKYAFENWKEGSITVE